MVKKPKTPEIDPKAHKRALRFFNAARTPGDLLELPLNGIEVNVDPEHRRKRPDPHEPIAKKPPVKLFDLKLAETVLRGREELSPVYGFSHIDQLKNIHGVDWIPVTELLWEWFGGATYGEWIEVGTVEAGGETIVARHAAVLRTGLVLLIEGACNPCSDPDPGVSRTPLWDPTTRTMKTPAPAPPGNNLYCSGHCFLSDGRLLTVGGGGESCHLPKNIAWLFDPETETWEFTKDTATNVQTVMNHGRWYPTAIKLGDEPGRVLVASGDLDNLCCEPPGDPCPWQTTAAPPMPMEVYSEATGRFDIVNTNGDKYFRPTYPGLHLLPGGEIFFAPVGFKEGNELVEPCAGNEESAYFEFTGLTTGTWTDVGPNDRTKGMSVLLLSCSYPFVQVLTVGGGDSGIAKTYQMINMSLNPEWDANVPLPIQMGETEVKPRIHPNLVLLPDGTVFVAGGSPTGEACWLYNPSTHRWSEMDGLTYERRYHSVAVLLPTAEVMATGGQWDPMGDVKIEVFRPPYLFRGPQPVIDSVSTGVLMGVFTNHLTPGGTFTIRTQQASEIAKVVLVRPMAVTHQTDSEQRAIELLFHQSGTDTLAATAPNGRHPHGMAPSGYYMLFILNKDGVPSVATFIRLSHLHLVVKG